jgi:uncharacterized protein
VADSLTPVEWSWQALDDCMRALGELVAADGPPDIIAAVLRGGAIPAVCLAHRLGVRDVRTIAVARTTCDAVNSPKSAPSLLSPRSLGHLAGRNVLVVDDVAGSGLTLDAAAAQAATAGADCVRTAVCVVNLRNWPVGPAPETAITYIGATCSTWVVFPWEQPE